MFVFHFAIFEYFQFHIAPIIGVLDVDFTLEFLLERTWQLRRYLSCQWSGIDDISIFLPLQGKYSPLTYHCLPRLKNKRKTWIYRGDCCYGNNRVARPRTFSSFILSLNIDFQFS